MRKLTVKGRYLAWDNGKPFFYLGDTAWEIFHRLNREEVEKYFECRSRQGFNAVQSVALAELCGVTVPNAYGKLPLHFTNELPDPAKPDIDGEYSYWDHVDFVIETAAKYKMFIVLLPTWGDKINKCWGQGPVIFNEDNAYTYGKWIAQRYADKENIIWMLGGDRQLEPRHRAIIDAMAKGIKEMDKNHLITFHPPGNSDSTKWVNDAEYIDFHTSQTGHTPEQSYESDKVMLEMSRASEKPYMNSEPRYEDNPACFNTKLGYCWDADDVRQNAYWDMLSGTCGHTYGNHCVWSMTKETDTYFPYTWEEVLERDGANQIGYLKKLRLSRDFFSLRNAPELIAENYEGMGHMNAAKGNDYGYIYSPLGVPFTVNLGVFENAGSIRASWFDPRTGKSKIFAILPAYGKTLLAPPTQGKGCDWVLILEAMI
ncbi:MAG: glycoside hydrolase family 140 protein [Oscillospiraceae bacterium]|nr:glycoside hydrolase family 140 protein [Oscillospiraceae bacterium]